MTRAVAIMNIGSGGAQGQISFVQNFYGGPINIQGTITGLTPGQHGFHIHQLGNLTDQCVSAAGHFNPYLMNHGSPTAVVSKLNTISKSDKISKFDKISTFD